LKVRRNGPPTERDAAKFAHGEVRIGATVIDTWPGSGRFVG